MQELLKVEYEILEATVDAAKAITAGAPQIFEDVPNNTYFDWELGDKGATDSALEGAAHITRLDLTNQRLIPNAINNRMRGLT